MTRSSIFCQFFFYSKRLTRFKNFDTILLQNERHCPLKFYQSRIKANFGPISIGPSLDIALVPRLLARSGFIDMSRFLNCDYSQKPPLIMSLSRFYRETSGPDCLKANHLLIDLLLNGLNPARVPF